MRTLIGLLVLLSFGCTQTPVGETGLEIYQVNKPYPISTSKTSEACSYCLDVTSEDLLSVPMLTERDIKLFDWENQQINLTEEARERIKDLEIPLEGLPMALVLNGEIIYTFWLWDVFSSFGCDRVLTYPAQDFKIEFGLPSEKAYGEDPRFDQRLKKYVTERMNRN